MSIQSEVPVRSGSTADWAAADATVLDPGELGVNTDTGELKIGDGTTVFASLPGSTRVRRGRATLVAGTVTVAATWVTATSVILLTPQVLGTVAVAKALAVTTRTPSTSFVITSADATDTSVIGWLATEV